MRDPQLTAHVMHPRSALGDKQVAQQEKQRECLGDDKDVPRLLVEGRDLR